MKTGTASFFVREVRRAVAAYIGSEGCYCCEGDQHDEHKAVLAKLLRVRKYKDGSGYDFMHYNTKPSPSMANGRGEATKAST